MLFAAAVLFASKLSADAAAKVDQAFAQYEHSNTPGCAVAVVRGGSVVYSRGYGMADLEHDVIITPGTTFDSGSVAKQFTAAAILALADAGKLSLDDDVRKYIPEVPDYGTRITLRQLLHHTSGLRDLGDIFAAHGFNGEDLVGDREALFFLAKQKTLNFPPGTEWRYSNTGYGLLAMVVTRVSGKPFRDFVREKVFAPAGMTSSDIRDNHRRLFHDRAVGYDPVGDGFGISNTNWESPGDTGVITSAEELARWTINGRATIERLLAQDALTTGERPAYGFGLAWNKRGEHRRIEHGGSTYGYRSNLVMLPDDDLSIAVMCNDGTANTGKLADNVADALLGAVAQQPAQDVPPHPDGIYVDASSASILRVGTKDGHTTINGAPLYARRDGRFDLGHFRVVAFSPGAIEVADFGGRAHRYVPAPPPKPVASGWAGRYHSDEAGADWTIVLRDGKLFAGSDRMPETQLKALYENAFELSSPVAVFIVEFGDGALTVSDRGVYRLRFAKSD